MRVKEVMNRTVIVAFPETEVTNIARLMARYGIGCVIIVNKLRNIIGIVTEQDVMNVVARQEDPRKLKAMDIMVTDVTTIDEDKTVDEAAKIMIENKIKKLPVVWKKEIKGIITSTDIMIAHTKIPKKVERLIRSKGADQGLVDKDFAYLNLVC